MGKTGVALLAVVVLGVTGCSGAAPATQAPPEPAPAAVTTPSAPAPTTAPTTAPATPRGRVTTTPPTRPARHRTSPCAHQTDGRFIPTSISIAGVTSGASVLAIPYDARGVPGSPPVTTAGKSVFAWEPHLSPGSAAGNTLLNAHTWPDGSALGNHLLAGLHEGDRIVVHGSAGAVLCYRVTDRVEVAADASVPAYFATDGPPQLAIIVCSGTRLGPGDWTERTIWYAAPAVT